MNKSTIFALLATASLTVSAWAETPENYKILEVNGQPIEKSFVLKVWEGLFPPGKAPDFNTLNEKMKMNVLRGIASEEVIFSAAMKSGVEDSAEVKAKLDALKKKLVTQAFLDKEVGSRITEEDLKKAYTEKTKQYAGKRELRASHILLSDEGKAQELIKKLKTGAEFDALAKSASEDKATAMSGGDLGFFTEDRMVPEFSKAAFSLKKGQISDPVKTDFGWHVIKVTDERPVKVPSFEEVKEELQSEVKEKAFREYVDHLVDSANVRYFDANGQEQEFSRTPDKSSARPALSVPAQAPAATGNASVPTASPPAPAAPAAEENKTPATAQ